MSSGGGNTQVTTEKPYEPSEPYLKDIMSEAENIYASDVGKSYFPNSTVVPFAEDTTRALNLQRARSYDLMSPSSIYGTAANTLGSAATGTMGDSYGGPMLGAGMGNAYTGRMGIGLGDSYAGGPAYNQLGTSSGDYLSDVRSSIGSDVMGQIASQFGDMGRTGTSPGAQGAATRAFTQQYAPIAQSAAEAERQRELGSREADLNRFQQAREGALGRTQQALQADIARQQTGAESMFNRQTTASQADIAREQTAREAALGRRMAGASGLPGLQGAMDQRFNMGISGLGGVGTAYEDLAGRQLQDQIARFDYQQQSPAMRLAQYASMINPIAGRGTSQYSTGPSANPLIAGLSGAYLGAQAFPGNPYAMAIGAAGGLLG
jgi:hypothetical protein